MAAGTKLVITFLDAYNAERNFSFSYVKYNATNASVKSAIQAIITNGSIFTHVPVSVKSAKMVTTTEQGIVLDQ